MRGGDLLSFIESSLQAAIDLVFRLARTIWLAIKQPELFRDAVRADRHYRLIVKPEFFLFIAVLLLSAAISTSLESVRLSGSFQTVEELARKIGELSIRPPKLEDFVTVTLPVIAILLVIGRLLPVLIFKRASRQHKLVAKAYYYSVGLTLTVLHPLVWLGEPLLEKVCSHLPHEWQIEQPLSIALIFGPTLWVAWRATTSVLGASPALAGIRRFKLRAGLVAAAAAGSFLIPAYYQSVIHDLSQRAEQNALETLAVAASKDPSSANTAIITILVRNSGGLPCYPLMFEGKLSVKNSEYWQAWAERDHPPVLPDKNTHVNFDCSIRRQDSLDAPILALAPGSSALIRVTVDLTLPDDLQAHQTRFTRELVKLLDGRGGPGPLRPSVTLHLDARDSRFRFFRRSASILAPL